MEIKLEPYIGPRPFESGEGALFFGRDRESSDLLSMTIAHQAILLYAQSGAGKTSMLNAKLIPLLKRAEFTVHPVVRVQSQIPKTVRLEDLPNVFVFATLVSWTGGKTNPEELVNKSLSDFLGARRHPGMPHAVIFDQFEEIFTSYLQHWRKRQGFFEQVSEMLEDDPLLRAVFAIREDYIAQLDPYASLIPEDLGVRFRLERLDSEAALEAITLPLKETDRFFAEGVAEQMVENLLQVQVESSPGESVSIEGEYVEPVQLQVVCQSLWHGLPPEIKEITQDNLQKFGNVDEVLSRFYDEAIRAASEKAHVDEKRLRDWCEETLITTIGMGTRGTVYRGRESTGGIPNAAIDVLENTHLIRAEWRAGARWYELTHDRFINPIRISNQHYKLQNSDVLQEASKSSYLALAQADQAFAIGDHDRALKSYENALSIYQKIDDRWGAASVHLNIGYIFADLQRHKEATEHFDRARSIFKEIRNDIGMANALVGLGYIDDARKNYEEAVSYFREALSIYRELSDLSGEANTHVNMGNTFGHLQNYDEALRHFQKALSNYRKLYDQSGEVNTLVGLGNIHHEMENYREAVKLFTQVIELIPSDLIGYDRRGAAYWYWGRYPEAIADYTRVIALDPNYLNGFNGRGHSLAENGKFEQAIIDLDRAIEIGNQMGEQIGTAYARNGRALAYSGLGQYQRALKEFDASLNACPDNGWAFYNRARTYERMGQLDKAIADYEQALRKDNPRLNPLKRQTAEKRLKQLKGRI